jgi:Flp pilus assembly protein TadD
MFRQSSQLTQEIERFTNQNWDFNTLKSFKESLIGDQDNLFFNLAIGLIYKRMGKNEEAYDLLNKLVEKYPENASALVNFGNINLILGDNQSALSLYRRAIKIEPGNAEAYYDMSLALSSLIKLEEADQAFNKAYELDPKKIQKFLNLKISDKGEPLDQIPTMNISDKNKIYSNLSSDDYKMFLNFFLVPGMMSGLVPIFIYIIVIAFIVALYRVFPMKLSDICDECGSIINRRAGCTLCISLLLPHNRVDQEKREKGVVKIWKNSINKKIIPFGLNLILPGGAAVYENRDIVGFSMIFLSFAIIGTICLSFFYAALPFPSSFLIFTYLIFYFISNLILFFRRF